ncbi:MAG: hypothetical protein IT381_30450 [Deltaproteobacteria bacterium]|nr:hypothetical protein [Deltaproteobacteria bacterium]
MVDGFRVLAQHDAMVMGAWKDVVILYMRGNATVPVLTAIRWGYREMLTEFRQLITMTIIDVVKIPRLQDDERAFIKQMSDEMKGKVSTSVQWVEGTGMAATTARVVLMGLQMLTKDETLTMKNREDAVTHIMEKAQPAWPRASLETAITETMKRASRF